MVEAQGQVAELGVILVAERGPGLVRRDIFVVALVVLARGREERLGQAVRFEQAGPDALAADRAFFLIFLPA